MLKMRGWIAGGLMAVTVLIVTDDALERGEYHVLIPGLAFAVLVGWLVHRSD